MAQQVRRGGGATKVDVFNQQISADDNFFSSATAKDSREAADVLLNRAQVATVPGIVFGAEGESHLRFSFSTSIETIEAGLDSLRRNL